jgi:hypothetical protein
VAASKGSPRDPEGASTRGEPEAPTCVPQVAVEATKERPV